MSLVSLCTGTPLTYHQVHQGSIDLVGERCCVVREFSRHVRSDGCIGSHHHRFSEVSFLCS